MKMNECKASVPEQNYGTVTFEGKKYTLTGVADHTNRLIPFGYNDRDENDGEYNFEMSAPATDEEGNEYTVYWIFANVEDWELDQYDYDAVDRVEEN